MVNQLYRFLTNVVICFDNLVSLIHSSYAELSGNVAYVINCSLKQLVKDLYYLGVPEHWT